MNLPAEATLCEVGPRDGFQYEAAVIPTDLKVAIIRGLVEAGLRRIQVTSFVHPGRVPQLADAEQVVARLPDVAGVRYSGLALNRRGVDRAREAGLRAVDVSIATWDEHSLDNAGMTVAKALDEAIDMVRRAVDAGMEVQIGLQTVFGFRTPGDTPIDHVLEMIEPFVDLGVESVSLADSTGMANPAMIAERVEAVRGMTGDLPLVLHLHDTRGLGLANVYEALHRGISRFDTAFGGMGGCPFLKGAAGNVATEDVTYLLESIGVRTGINVARVAELSRRIARQLGTHLPGKVHRIMQAPESPPVD